MYSQARLSIAAVYLVVHWLLACRYAVLYCQSRHSLFVVTRGLALLLTNLLASMIIAAACCLRQIAADTPPDSPLAFQIPCGYMEAAVLCMMTMLWPTVMDRGLVLMVKFDPTLRQRYGKYITTRSRAKMLAVYVLFGILLYLGPELLGAECFVRGTCHYPNCLMGSNLKALLPLSSIMGTVMFLIAYRLSRLDLEQEGLGIKEELNLNLMTQGLLTPCMVIQISMQFGVVTHVKAWEFVVTVLQVLGVAIAFYASHIQPSLRLGFAPEPLASLFYGSRIAPEGGSQSSLHNPRAARHSHSSLQLSASMETGHKVGLDSSLRKNLLSGNRVPPIVIHQEANQSAPTTPRSPSGRMLVASARGEGSLADALLLRGARVSPALNGWDLQLDQWLSLEPKLQVHLDHPALLQCLKEAAVQPPSLATHAGSSHGTLMSSFSNKRHGPSHEKKDKDSKDVPVNGASGAPTTHTPISTVPEFHNAIAEARTTQEDMALQAADGRQFPDPEVASVASLLEVARSGLQEEAVRFVLVVLVMRSLDPKDKTHREMIRQHCNFLLATHFDLKSARYRLDVSSEADAAALREVQKLARRVVLFEDDVSSAMHSFDDAFSQVWPAVYELLANYCVSLAVLESHNTSSAHSSSAEIMDDVATNKGRARRGSMTSEGNQNRSPSRHSSQSGTAEGAAAIAASLLSPFAAAGQALGRRLSLSDPLHGAGEGRGGGSSPDGDTGPGIATHVPSTMATAQKDKAQPLPQSGQQPSSAPDTSLQEQTHSPPAEQTAMPQGAPSEAVPAGQANQSSQADSQTPSVDVKAEPLPSIVTTTANPIFTDTQGLAAEPTVVPSPNHHEAET